MKIRALIVDDERLARSELRKMLADAGVEVVGEAAKADEAVCMARALKPDVVFMDVQMPGASGFDAVGSLDAGVNVIFVTAYDQYAIRAFEINALDYLLKPVRSDRLYGSLQRLKSTHSNEKNSPALKPEDPLFVALNGRMAFLRIEDIAWVQAAGDYVTLYAIDGRHGLANGALKQWVARLPSSHFIQIHRRFLVNVEHIIRIEKKKNATCLVFVDGYQEPIPMSRRHARRLKSNKVMN